MSHWRASLLGLGLLLALTAGCKQPMFIAERDLQRIGGDLLPATLEKDPTLAMTPVVEKAPAPPSVNDPTRKPRYITLEEILAIGLENGTANTVRFGEGVADDRLGSVTRGQYNGDSEWVRVLALQPAFAYTNIENQLARYDAQWITSINSSATDTLQQGLQSFQNGQSASFATSFFKAMPSGGIANLGFQTDYRLLSSPPTGAFGVLNPSYTTKLVLGFEQPLWRDYGVDINQLLARHPQAQLLNSPGIGQFSGHQNAIGPFNQQAEGILIARTRYGMQKTEFERQIHSMVLNLEVAYWNLYRSYGKLHSATEVFRIAHRVWMAAKARFDVGGLAPQEYFRVEELLQETRAQRQAALADVIEKERNLRRVAGLPLEDGMRLVLVTPPVKANYQPNYEAAIQDALTYRPELTLARENLRIAHWQFKVQENSVKPDIRAFGNYSPTGFGTRLDGHGGFKDGIGVERNSNALRSLSSGHFNDWTLGLVLNVPLGYRAELANIRAARLNLASSYYLLKDQEEKAKSYVTQQWQAVLTNYSLIEMRAAQRAASQKGAVAQIRAVEIGKEKYDINLLDVIRRLGTSMDAEYDAIFEYNNALARFEAAKGTILHHNNIYLSEGPLPECAQVRAVEHERERTKARVLRDRPRPLEQPGWFEQICGDSPVGQINVDDPAALEVPRKLEATPNILPSAPLPGTGPAGTSLSSPQERGAAGTGLPSPPLRGRGAGGDGATPPTSLPFLPSRAKGIEADAELLSSPVRSQEVPRAQEAPKAPASPRTFEFRREPMSEPITGQPLTPDFKAAPAPPTTPPASLPHPGAAAIPTPTLPPIPDLPPLPSDSLVPEPPRGR